MKKFEFDAVLVRPEGTGTWTFLDIPTEVTTAFGVKGQVRVTGMINGHPYRSSAMPRGDGAHYMVVKKEIRDAIGVTQGDTVHVVMEKDTAPRTVDVPSAFAEALKENNLEENFETLSYSQKKEYVDWIVVAKKEETRLRRIAKSLGMLAEGRTPKSPKKK